MNKKVWDLYAPIYKKAMKADHKIYEFMYERISEVIQGREVLEIATGPGMLAKHIAPAARRVIATDYSEGMIAEARKGDCPDNLSFEIADAMDLPYDDHSFDVVIISNALHIVSDPRTVLREIRRVLRSDGTLIAPNFVGHRGSFGSRIWAGMLRIGGIQFEHQWTAQEYIRFLEEEGWKVQYQKEMRSRIPLLYVESVLDESFVYHEGVQRVQRSDRVDDYDRKTEDTLYVTEISDARWIAYDIPGNIGWITYAAGLGKSICDGEYQYAAITAAPAALMAVGITELVSERVQRLDRTLPRKRLYRGFGALTLGGITGAAAAAAGSTVSSDKKVSTAMCCGATLCAAFAGLLLKGYKRKA